LAGLPLAVVRDVIRHRLLALAGLGKNMDEPEFVHLFRRIGPAAEHQLFCWLCTQFPCQKNIRADTREHSEDMVRK